MLNIVIMLLTAWIQSVEALTWFTLWVIFAMLRVNLYKDDDFKTLSTYVLSAKVTFSYVGRAGR